MISQLVNTYDMVHWSNPVACDHGLNRGLVAWWLAAPGRYGVGSLRWVDLLRRHTGVLTGTPTWGGAGLRLHGTMSIRVTGGTSSYVATPHSSRLNLSETASTVAWWLYAPHTQPQNNSGFFDKGAGDGANQHAWSIRPQASTNDGQIRLLIEDNHATFAAGSYPNNQWAHFVMTWDGTSVRLYRNGLLIETVAQPSGTFRSSNTDTLNIGALVASGPTPLSATCRLDDIRLYDARVLTDREINELYKRSCRYNEGLLNRIPLPSPFIEQAAAQSALLKMLQHHGISL